MPYLTERDYVCLVSDFTLEEARRKKAAGNMWHHTGLWQYWWRVIDIVTDAKGLTVHIANTQESTALNGHYPCPGCGPMTDFKLAWDDINDRDGLIELMVHEEASVWARFDKMMDRYRLNMVELRKALA